MTFLATDEQLDAINSLDVNCIVTAGAGSGKTFVLVERFLKIIEEYSISNPNIIEEIVAITFTEKAAREMKERIRKDMVIRKEYSLNNNLIDKAMLWSNNIQRLEYANISTFHSFCAKILREYPVEANLDPEFRVLDSTEANWLISEVVEKELKKLLELEMEKENSLFYKWVQIAGFKRTVSEIIKVYNQVSNHVVKINEIKGITLENFKKYPYQLIDDWESLITYGDNLYCSEGSSKKLKAFQDSWGEIKEQILLNKNKGDNIVAILYRLEELTAGNFGASAKEQRKKMNEYVKIVKELVDAIEYHQDEQKYLEGFYLLLEKIDTSYGNEKDKINSLDFDDLMLKVIDLLNINKDIKDKIHRKISFLMIDEFQDSNKIQKILIELLLENGNKKVSPGSLFVVGDPKQSIYRFRGADVRVFKEMEQEISQASGRVKSMQKNFRSVSEIIYFINFFFAHIMSKNPDSPNYYEKAIPKSDCIDKGKIEFIPIYHDNQNEQGVREKEAVEIAEKIRNLLLEKVEPREIAILFRSMSNIKIYEQELIRMKIPYYIVGGRGFFQKQEIYDLLNVLEYLQDSSNKIALSGILRSPMVAVTDDTLYKIMTNEIWLLPYEEWGNNINNINDKEKRKLQHFASWFTSIKKKLGRVNISEIVENIVDKTNYKAILFAQSTGMQVVANIEKFIRMVKEYPGDNPFSIFELLQRLNRMIEDEQQVTEAAIESEVGNTIKLMTIHQSKGLQFPYVFVPDLSRKSLSDTSLIKFDLRIGLTCRTPSEIEEWSKPLRWLIISNYDKKLDREESVRILYVAMTRVIKKLILSGKVEDTKGKFSTQEILQADTWSKWFDIIMEYDSISLEKNIWTYKVDESIKEIGIVSKKNQISEPKEDDQKDENVLEVIEKKSNFISNQLGITDYSNRITLEYSERMYSISAIKRYLKCPRYYFYIDILSLNDFSSWFNNNEEILTNLEDNVEYSWNSVLTPAFKGIIVHQLLEEFTKYPDNIKHWEKYFTMYIKEHGITKETTGELGILTFKAEVKEFIINYRKSRFYDTTLIDAKTELDFILNLNNGKIYGVIDRLDIINNELFTIIDYKTDKVINSEQYIPQIMTYALAVSKNFNLHSKIGFLYFIRYDVAEEIEINKSILNNWEIKLEEILCGISESINSGHFDKNISQCDNCEFKMLCTER